MTQDNLTTYKVEIPDSIKFDSRETVEGNDGQEYLIKSVLVNPRREKFYYIVQGGRFDDKLADVTIYSRSRAESEFNKISDREYRKAGETVEIPESNTYLQKRWTVKRNIDGDDNNYRVDKVLYSLYSDDYIYGIKGGRFDNVKVYSQRRGDSTFEPI